jgi:hypothetical protein
VNREFLWQRPMKPSEASIARAAAYTLHQAETATQQVPRAAKASG